MADQLGAKVAGFTVVGLGLLAGVVWGGVYLYAGDKAPRHARVEGVSIGGLSPAAAEQKLREQLGPRTEEPITVSYGDGRTVDVDPDETGLSIDYTASIEKAGGGSGLGLSRMWDVLAGGENHHAEVAVDQSRMQPALDDLDEGVGRRPREGTITFEDGRAIPSYGEAGLVVSRNATQELLERRFLHGGSEKLPTQDEQPDVSDDEVRRALAEFGRPAVSAPVTLVLAGRRVVAPPRLFSAGLSMTEVDGTLEPKVDGELVLESLRPLVPTVAPVDARFVIRKGKPRVVPARPGVEVDPAELDDRFAAVVVRRGADRRLVLRGKATTQPAFTTADAQALKITQRVSTFTTHFPYAEYRNVNLPRAAELIDGTVLRPGETFSLNDTVGERTKANGFTEGYIISDGLFRKDLGGGVSQIATTTFNAAYFAGLKDVEHKPHSVYIDRYPEGREATVAWPTVDLKFTNTTPYGVLIKAHVRRSTPSREGDATVTMYSTRHWRITSSNGPRTDYTAPKVRYLQAADCEEASGTSGFSVNVFRTFHALGSGKVLRTEKFHTDYIPGDTLRCGAPPKATPERKPKPGRS